jgi:lipoate-protein ligase A
MSRLRIIHDPPASGTWNMAIDEMMLETVAASGQPLLRFYEWSEPTLSLGYFQAIADRHQHAASLSCAAVRRSTGGGAILHDRELTYSIALPLADRWSQAATKMYDLFHGSLINTLAHFGFAATLCEATLHRLTGEPFLCFQRRAKGDVLLGSHKIAGSAQRRKFGALLQHGSVLFERSRFAPELFGILNTAEFAEEKLPSLQDFSALWQKILITSGGEFASMHMDQWQTEEIDRARIIEKEQFTADHWNSRR